MPGSTGIPPLVVVGMSGGVDSSAAAMILKEQGYRVMGVTLRVWDEEGGPDKKWQDRSCCKIGIARYVAEKLGIDYRVIDIRPEFRETVIRDFVQGYQAGETPNPCVRCNEWIKFGRLWKTAEELGADYLATGHYVRLEHDPASGRSILKKGLDSAKDQSYFLCRVRPSILPRLIFPVGHLQKKDVWEKIRALDLPVEELRESQEICFVNQKDYREFIREESELIPTVSSPRPGLFISSEGKTLGSHRGIGSYTVGQRRGLGLSGPDRQYVVEIRPEDNAVVVGGEEELFTPEVRADRINLFVPWPEGEEKEVQVKVRYRTPPVQARVKREGPDQFRAVFSEPQRGVAPGQSLVIYSGDQMLAGAMLIRTEKESRSRLGKAGASPNAAPAILKEALPAVKQ